jgi:D-Tyr-tRNAtyr deacylase
MVDMMNEVDNKCIQRYCLKVSYFMLQADLKGEIGPEFQEGMSGKRGDKFDCQRQAANDRKVFV